jgi:hypothetical protein
VLRRPVESGNYTSAEFAATLTELGLRRSVGRTGICYDNAMAESFFAALKNERVHRTAYPTRAHARADIARYIEFWYNRNRLHSWTQLLHPARSPRILDEKPGRSLNQRQFHGPKFSGLITPNSCAALHQPDRPDQQRPGRGVRWAQHVEGDADQTNALRRPSTTSATPATSTVVRTHRRVGAKTTSTAAH